MAQCTTCGAGLKAGATRCVKCGSAVDVPAPASQPSQPAPSVQSVQIIQPVQYVPAARPAKSKSTAAILAFFLGGLGVHKFYLGQAGWGIAYLLLCWTFVPAVVALVEGIVYLSTSDEAFHQKYG